MNEFERLLVQQQSVRLLQSIEVAAWAIVGLLAIVVVVLLVGAVRRYRSTGKPAGWSEIVENAYEAGRYDQALQTLESSELLFPRSAAVKFWQGRCYFQQESWAKAAEKFEACCRLEPPYRRSVRDYMAFIELNELVPGVSGYARRKTGELLMLATAHNQQLERTVMRHRGYAASAPFHYAHASRFQAAARGRSTARYAHSMPARYDS